MRPEELAAAAARIIGPAYEQAYETVIVAKDHVDSVDPLVFGLTVFVLAVFIGYYVVWRVTRALHSPLMAVTGSRISPAATSVPVPNCRPPSRGGA